jgi:hypothetical protein
VTNIARAKTDLAILRISAWSGPVYMVIGVLGFAVLAGFWPPPGENLTAEQLGALFRDHNTGIRAGMVLMAFAGPFYFVWSAVLSKIIGRIEGELGVLSSVEIIGGLMTALVTFLPATVWLAAALRPESRSDHEVQVLFDFGWMFFDVTYMCTVFQNVALGIAIQSDRRAVPLMPGWIAWLSYAVAATFFPLSLMPFFRTGPFAWQGLISFWVVFVMFFVEIVVVTAAIFPALRIIERELEGSRPQPAGSPEVSRDQAGRVATKFS